MGEAVIFPATWTELRALAMTAAGEVLLVFCCAAPLALALSSLVAYGLHSLTHRTTSDVETFSTLFQFHL
jgi:hypothetical protein